MNNDLISRSALKEEIEKALDNAELSEYEACICVTSIYDKCIDNAPTVEITETEIQEVLNKRCMTAVANEYLVALHGGRPKGEWIYHKSDGYFLPYMECSNCKVQDLLENLTKKEYREVNHFCFNCGADMRGKEE